MIKWMIRKVRGSFKPMERNRSLNGIPVIRSGIESQPTADGGRILVVPRQPFAGGLIGKYFPIEVEPARIQMDELGNKVWELIDGERSVRKIIDRFAKETGIHRREAEYSVTAHLKNLMQRNIIVIAVK